jgi:phenylalanyl-tRNA synthetase beta chain
VVLANPIASQMGVMRSSLIGGLVGTLAANRKRQIERVRVFEIGRCFLRDEPELARSMASPSPASGGLAAGPAAARAVGHRDAPCRFLRPQGRRRGLVRPASPGVRQAPRIRPCILAAAPKSGWTARPSA